MRGTVIMSKPAVRTFVVPAVVALLALSAAAQTPFNDFAAAIGGSEDDTVRQIVMDSLGNVHVLGQFRGTVDFDPGAGEFMLTSQGDRDVFVLELDSAGQFVSAVQIGGPLAVSPRAIDVDSDRNIHIIGQFSGTVDFDPGPGVQEVTSSGGDSFLLKLNSAGEFSWVRTFSGLEATLMSDIVVDGGGMVFVGGHFRGSIDFDPGPGDMTLTQTGAQGAYLWQLDPNGDLVRVTTFNDPDQHVVNSIVRVNVDDEVRLALAGTFVGVIDFDPGPNVVNLTSSIFGSTYVVMLEEDGSFFYAGDFTGSDVVIPVDMVADSAGGVYITGEFTGSADFDPGSEVFLLQNFDFFPMFQVALDPFGNFRYAYSTAGANVRAIAVGPNDAVYTVGSFSRETDFDPGVGDATRFPSMRPDGFIQKLDIDGNYVYDYANSGPEAVETRDILVADEGAVYTIGNFDSFVDLADGPGILRFDSLGETDIFIQRLDEAGGEGEGEGEGELPTLTPATGNFGLLATGDSRTLTFRMINGGAIDLPVTLSLSGANAGAFSLASATSFTLPAGDFALVDIAFAPTATGDLEASLDVETGLGVPLTFMLSGTALTGFGGIEGTVVDDGGMPVECGAVAVQGTGGGDAVVVPTDVDGNYAANSLPAGDYTVTAVAPGFASQITNATLAAGPNQSLDFQLIPGETGAAVITGQVTVEGGDSIGGVRVDLINPADDSSLGFTYTCADGRYEIPVPDLKVPVRIQFTASGFQSVVADAETDDNTPINATLALEAGAAAGVAQGSVTDSGTNGPIADARVLLTNNAITRSTQTGAAGTFSLASLLEGQYTALVTASGYSTLSRPVTIFAGDPTPVSLQLTSLTGEGEGEGEGEGDTEGNGEPACGAAATTRHSGPSVDMLVLLLATLALSKAGRSRTRQQT